MEHNQNLQVVFDKSRVVRRLTRKDGRVTSESGLSSWPKYVDDGQEEVWYRVEVDTKRLANMGCRAAANKKGKCVDGPLVVTVLSRTRIAPTPTQQYGEFRVCWNAKDHVASRGEGLGWNEDKATSYCAELQEASGQENWLEHWDPETREWKRW